jgi:cobyrinic acid a,c-diamide synthase
VVALPARLVIAAPASGAGKTTLATGLMAALHARGLRVSPHKVGPDYIDPTYHALATGRPGRNLDPVLVGEQLIAPLFAHGCAGPDMADIADIAVVEGVMGLFDGRGATREGSTAHVASLLDAPVVLIVDASAQSSSVAALVHGFATYDPTVSIAGVVLNRVASARHEQLLRESLAGELTAGIAVLGALPRTPDVEVPSRHLGLVPAQERGRLAVDAVAGLGALIEQHVDVDAVLALARSAPARRVIPWSAADAIGEVDTGVGGRPVVAVAGGEAFTFGYTEACELLAAAGAEVARVDPLRDERLPTDTRALVIGGGFPEIHAAQLSANAPLRAQVRKLAVGDAPIAAECAGLLYLAQTLDGSPMCGVLPVDARMTSRLTLGYRDAVHTDGTVVRAHEFHRTACTPPAGAQPAYTLADGTPEGFAAGRVHASYLHLHWAGSPQLVRGLVASARRHRVAA